MSQDSTQWVYDHHDGQAHLLADSPSTSTGEVLVTMCGRTLPTATTPTFGVAPSLTVCPTCGRHGHLERPPATFPPRY